MKVSHWFVLSLSLLFMGCSGCGNDHQKSQQQAPANLEEQLIDMHRRNLQDEEAIINNFVKEQGLDMKKTDTGLRYSISSNGEGEPVEDGQAVTFQYELRLLDSTFCYSSDLHGPLVFRVGHDDVVRGLHEGALMMRSGDRATMILPSRLGYGLTGDQERIPGGAILVYDLELVDVQ